MKPSAKKTMTTVRLPSASPPLPLPRRGSIVQPIPIPTRVAWAPRADLPPQLGIEGCSRRVSKGVSPTGV
eukprot:9498677-Pyramimonas_sp.AAC.1